jgi:hypothetical protein
MDNDQNTILVLIYHRHKHLDLIYESLALPPTQIFWAQKL